MSNTGKSLQTNRQGIVSITVTVVFIMVISLIVLGFSQVSRRNNRAAVDRQLSSQAYYAAESAVNDAVNKIAIAVETGQPIPVQAGCKDSTKYTKNNGDVPNAPNGVRYTCLKVNPNLKKLQYDKVSSPVVVPLNASAGNTLGTNEITWTRVVSAQAGATIDQCPTRNRLPISSEWASKCPFGLLRVDIVPLTPGDTGTLGNPDNAAAQTMTVFLYPKRGAADVSVPYKTTTYTNPYGNFVTQGAVIDAACDANTCKASVTGLDFSNAYMRIQSLYQPAQNLIVAATVGNTTLDNAQVEIDATGKAQDVLRRIVVRYPVVGGSRSDVPEFAANALQSSGSVCKYFTAAPSYFDIKDARCN